MPSHFAHYHFGKEILRRVNSDDRIKKTINMSGDSIDAFKIALQGPDILAFYKPACNNALNMEGALIHRNSGINFFERATKYVVEDPSPEKFSYLIGFMCHYILDSMCHPLVTKYMDIENLSHSKIERDFDTYLLALEDCRPLGLDLEYILPSNPNVGAIASSFFHSADPTKINKAISSMRTLLSCLASKNDYLRNAEYVILSSSSSFNDKAGMVASEKSSPLTIQSNVALYKKLNEAIDVSIKEINNLLDCIIKRTQLGDSLELNFLGQMIM